MVVVEAKKSGRKLKFLKSEISSVPQRQDSISWHTPTFSTAPLHTSTTPQPTRSLNDNNTISNRQDGSPPLERQGNLLLRHPLLPPGPHLVQIDPRQRRRTNLQTRSKGRHPISDRCCVEGQPWCCTGQGRHWQQDSENIEVKWYAMLFY
jgi:hypothetical protein